MGGAGHPVVLCTDDSGVFNTSLSKEFAIAAQAFQLSREELFFLCLRAVDHTFLGEHEKSKLRNEISSCRSRLLQ